MSELFPEGRPSVLETRRDAVKAGLSFGEVAQALGLAGSSRAGWDCPGCAAERTLKERADCQGARCRSCGTGFDIISLAQTTEGLSFTGALSRLEAIQAQRASQDHTTGRLL